MSPGLGVSFLARRARSSWLLLACVAVTVLLATALATTAWTFMASAIQPGARRILAAPEGRVIGLSGPVENAGGVATDTRLIAGLLGQAWPGTGYRMGSAVWANPVSLSPSRAVRAEASPVPGTPRPLQWQIQIGALDGIGAQTVLAAGRWPGPPARGGPLPVALPVAVARLLHVVPGSVLRTAAQSGPAAAGLRVTGLFRVRDPASPYWAIDLVPVTGFAASALPGGGIPGSIVTYGPAVVNLAAFRGGLAAGQGSWFVLPQAAALARQDTGVLTARTSQMVDRLATSVQPSGLQATTRLLRVLAGIASTIVLARSLFTIGALALLLVAAAALVLASRLLASVREEDSALLRARGATGWQLARPALAEALVLATAAGLAGVLAGVRLAGPLAALGGVRLDSGQAARVSPLAWLSALIMVAVCVAVLAWPALHTVTPDAARARQGRQARLAGAAWAGGDLAVAALAALAVWQLRGYTAVAHPAAGPLGVDPAVAVAPALALAGVALIPLRTLPLLARAADRAADHGRRLAAAMVSWQIGRRPIRQAGPVLLVVAATATSTLALAGYQSWRQSAADQAAFAAGADVRVDAAAGVQVSTGTFTRSPEVTAAAPAGVTSIGNGSQLIALGTATAGSTILLRPDLSALPVRTLWRSIIPPRRAGLALPGRPDRLRIVAALGAGPGTSAAAVRRELGSATVTALVQDADGITFRLPAGILPADGQRHALAVPLSGALAGLRRGGYPLRLLRLTLTFVLPRYDPVSPPAAPDASLSIDSLAAAGGAALASWQAAVASPNVPAGPPAPGRGPPIWPPWDGGPPSAIGWHRGGGSQQLAFSTGHAPAPWVMRLLNLAPRTLTASVSVTAQSPLRYVPAIATRGYLAATRLHVGSITWVPVGGLKVPFVIVAAVARFPAVFGPNRALIADLGAVSDMLAARQAPPLAVNRLWLRTRGGWVPHAPAGLSVTARARLVAALLHNPLLKAPRQAMLAVGLAAVLLGVLGCSVSVAASVRSRRTQRAVLGAMGVSRRAQAGQLCLEQLVLSLPAAAVGLLAGIALTWLMVPAITLTADAANPVPPPLPVVPLGLAAALALVTAALPAAAAALSIARRPDPAGQLRAEAR